MFNIMEDLSQDDQGIPRRTKRMVFVIGLVVYLAGLYLLTYVNAMADNWAGTVAPLCIIGGLVTIFISLILKPEEAGNR